MYNFGINKISPKLEILASRNRGSPNNNKKKRLLELLGLAGTELSWVSTITVLSFLSFVSTLGLTP